MKTLEKVIAIGKAAYEANPNKNRVDENSYLLGCMQGAYLSLYLENQRLENKLKEKNYETL